MRVHATMVIEPGRPDGLLEVERNPRVVVECRWVDAGTDRDDAVGWSLGADTPRARQLAARLIRAIHAGLVFVDNRVQKDVNGRTFVQSTTTVRGRGLNAQLRRLGF